MLRAGVTAIGIRPEDLSHRRARRAGALAGEIYVVEPMGNETLVDVRIGGERVPCARRRGFTAPIGSTDRRTLTLRSLLLRRWWYDSGAPRTKRGRSTMNDEESRPTGRHDQPADAAAAGRRAPRSAALPRSAGGIRPAPAPTPARRSSSAPSPMAGSRRSSRRSFRSPRRQGFDIEFLEDEYGVTLEKWFADAQNKAGQYDLYLLDDPWVPAVRRRQGP